MRGHIMKLVLSTSNIVSGGPSVVRRITSAKSNVELLNSLRYNFVAAQQIEPAHTNESLHGTHSPPRKLAYSDYTTWTSKDADTLYVPAIDFSTSGLTEDRSQYDITVKLFYLPGIPASRRCEHTCAAIDLVLKELHVGSIDLLIVSFPGIAFDADDEEEEVVNGDAESEFNNMVQTWRTLESLHEKGMIAQLGLAEFDKDRLEKFLPYTKIRPSVDQINVKDCCVVPKDLILYAKEENIELLTHNDCTDILPRGTTRDLLSRAENGAGILAVAADADDGGIKGDIEPQWVVKYTAVVKDRGVIENKGYFALAEVGTCIRTSS
ncbi:glutamate-cysteine ligase modifier subunit [Coccidioides immitis H538.4]|uniref:GCS light chain n=4 Tax=Coccidioides TaxID=5500 RepID=A0A0J8ULE1_COCIT|nr:glutamate-cysteine ligase modifier subunit [Coccidioides immitis H538.4]